MKEVHVVGAGLAGTEAALYLAGAGIPVCLFEMRPNHQTEAHKTHLAGELVCSNSLKSRDPQSAPGILKAEMRQIGSKVLEAADQSAIPGGQALTVNRDQFSACLNGLLDAHPLIQRKSALVERPSEGVLTILATGPLTATPLQNWLTGILGGENLYFYDAIAPILEGASVDTQKAYLANRYDKGGEASYWNCPLDKGTYEAFVQALLDAEQVVPKAFEKPRYFQACQPIEEIARKGFESLRFGPMKPVGLVDPRTGDTPYAVVQLRSENLAQSAFNMVGFQTRLKHGEQQRIFRMIPALEHANFLRLGSIHRNTYLDAPRVLRPNLSLKGYPLVFAAGQLTGVEGYIESAAIGLLAAIFVLQAYKNSPHSAPPPQTALHALHSYLLRETNDYQPGQIHFGMMKGWGQGDRTGRLQVSLTQESEQSCRAWLQAL